MPWTKVYPKAVVHPVGDVSHTTFVKGHPTTILNHFTVTCGATWPATGRFQSEGVGPQFAIKADGTVCQYVDLTVATWHARGMSMYAVGIEYDFRPKDSADPPNCDITLAQLEAGAELNAWLCKTFEIPAVRAPGYRYTAGIKVHTDGLEDGGDAWDIKRHWDSIWKAEGDPIAQWASAGQRIILNRSPWTSQKFIGRVNEILHPNPPGNGGDMAGEADAVFKFVLDRGATVGDVGGDLMFDTGYRYGYRGVTLSDSLLKSKDALAGWARGQAQRASDGFTGS